MTGAYGSVPLVQMLQDDRSVCVLSWTFQEQDEGTPLGTYLVPKYGNKKGTPIRFDGSRSIRNAVRNTEHVQRVVNLSLYLQMSIFM